MPGQKENGLYCSRFWTLACVHPTLYSDLISTSLEATKEVKSVEFHSQVCRKVHYNRGIAHLSRFGASPFHGKIGAVFPFVEFRARLLYHERYLPRTGSLNCLANIVDTSRSTISTTPSSFYIRALVF